MSEAERTSRTSVVLPEELWLRAKTLAAHQHRDLRALIIEGLELVLARDEGRLPKIRAQGARTRASMRYFQMKTKGPRQ